MASVSVSHAIMFIASLLVAATVAGALVSGVDRISESVSDRSLDTSEDIRTDVEIISDPGSDAVFNETEDGGVVTLLVKNTGSVNLLAEESQLDVLVNGRFATDVAVERADGNDGSAWDTSEVVRVTVTVDEADLNAHDQRVKLIVNGDEEVFRFRI